MPTRKGHLKEFRLVAYMNAPESRGFYGGRSAASPLAYYYHTLKYSKVILGGSIIFKGLGKYYSFIKGHLEKKGFLDNLPTKIDCNGEKVIFSDVGYIYQNFDPLFTHIRNGIFWQYTIEKIVREKRLDEEKKRYLLSSTRIAKEEYINMKEIKKGSWKALVSNFQRLKSPLTFEREHGKILKIYDGNNYECNFYKNCGTPSLPRNNAFVHLKTGFRWSEFDRKQEFMSKTKLSPTEIIDDQIKNNHIHESLVHEMLKVLIAEKGWYINFELPVKGKKKKGRIDFLIKKTPNHADPWSVIEVKLGDNPDAVEQLSGYIDSIRDMVRDYEHTYYDMLWDGKKVKEIKGVILCADPASDETIEKANANNFDVWTYNFVLKQKSKQPRLGIKIFDAKNRRCILETK